jgi:hypothetical protein
MDNQQIVKFLTGTSDVSLLQSVQTTLGLTQPCIQWAPGSFVQGIEWPRSEADHLHLMLIFRKRGAMLHSPICNHGMHRDYFTITFVFLELLKNMHSPEPF